MVRNAERWKIGRCGSVNGALEPQKNSRESLSEDLWAWSRSGPVARSRPGDRSQFEGVANGSGLAAAPSNARCPAHSTASLGTPFNIARRSYYPACRERYTSPASAIF